MENSLLFLRTTDGIANNNLNTSHTWNNINLRNLLGPMYDKYERFNIVLTNIATNLGNSTLGTTVDDLSACVNISGLPFNNATYDVKSGNNKNSANLVVFNFQRNASRQIFFTGSNFLTFGKSQDMANITISLTQFSGASLASAVAYPDAVYIFSIVGVPNENDKTLMPPERIDNNNGRIK